MKVAARLGLGFVTAAMALITTGCAGTVSVRLVNQTTEQPIVGARVERVRVVTEFGKIVNPIGSPYRTVEMHWTNAKGACELQKLGPHDSYRLLVSTFQPITLTLGESMLTLSPKEQGGGGTSCVYSVRQVVGIWQTTAWQPSSDWQQERNTAPH